jgi:hypothetical protein
MEQNIVIGSMGFMGREPGSGMALKTIIYA